MHVSIEAPEIAQYPKGFPDYWVRVIWVRPASKHFQVRALATTYVRLVEAALRDYRLGVARLHEFWGTHDAVALGAFHWCISHFESCLSNMYRAINCYRCLRRHKSGDPLCRALNDSKPRFAADLVAYQIRGMRNEIHHLEELVLDGRLEEGQPQALMPDGPETPHPTEPRQTIKSIDRLVISGREIKFSEIATWLTEMGRCAERIAQFEPEKVTA